ncbi:MAG: SDR family oxidoreductase [Telmatospirillum sp.]|nr:SDR family oxidoreductase [Telmatospirillum sp.]
MKLAGKTAIVTGAGSGIGRASALLFAAEGAKLAVVDRDAAGAAATVASIAAAGGVAKAFVADVAAPEAAAPVVDYVRGTWGRIDILMCAAGFSCGGTVETTALEDWNAVFAANVGGTWLWAKAAIPAMRAAGGGAILTVSSQLALAGGRGNSAYIAAKGALLSLTRTMALDFAADKIRVNALVPGAIDTPLLARGMARSADPAAMRERVRQRHALGRIGTVDEVARAALFLASDDSSFTTGTALAVDGGWLAG